MDNNFEYEDSAFQNYREPKKKVGAITKFFMSIGLAGSPNIAQYVIFVFALLILAVAVAILLFA